MVRFLHVADLHLGMRITRFPQSVVEKIREARFQALENVLSLTRGGGEAPVDFVLIAGDLFDDVRVERTMARRVFKFLTEAFTVPVFVLTGNHDPLEPGSVWDSEPWVRAPAGPVRVLRERVPVEAVPGVTLFPCPVLRKTSTEDPTRWIAEHPRTPGQGIRIGVAHGSVMDRPNLPEDDHPIPPTAATDLDLDYLALGHWHRHKIYRDAAGHPRTVYPGVHEPMRFSGDANSTGWRAYSPGGEREEFLDDGRGLAMDVTIAAPGAPPMVTGRDVRHHRWMTRSEEVRGDGDISRIISEVATAPDTGRTLLRLRLSGAVPMSVIERVDELREVFGRYVVAELDDSGLIVEPTEEEIRERIGEGILRTVYDRLRGAPDANGHAEPGASAGSRNGDSAQSVHRRAMTLLYRYAMQARGRQ